MNSVRNVRSTSARISFCTASMRSMRDTTSNAKSSGSSARTLKGASETLRNLFFSNMSERACKMLREEMQALGPVRLRDVGDAQQAMVKLAKQLADKDEIIIADQRGGEDELVY